MSSNDKTKEFTGKGITFDEAVIEEFLAGLDFSKIPGNLVPVVAQDAQSNELLMLAFANAEAIRETLRTGIAVYWSRSRGKFWRKGEESGHVQILRDVRVDCYKDTVVYIVDQKVAACHTGYFSCFYRHLTPEGLEARPEMERLFDPDEVYKK